MSIVRVLAFIDGFNLYHALDRYDRGANTAEKERYRKYKWLDLTSLVRKFILPRTETLVGVEYFTAYPDWDAGKLARHRTYVSAQIKLGVHVTFGEFKQRTVRCRAVCRQEFYTREEKQTDVNIAVAMLGFASRYDKLILVTADSDQVPALKLLKATYPQKVLASLPPVGRRSNELRQVSHQSLTMTETHLIQCQLPSSIPLLRDGKQYGSLDKPQSWK
jgi:uncharacterized LabA/DUF88 family protein